MVDRQQNPGNREIRQHRRPSITQERRRHTGKREQIENPERDQKQFGADQERQAEREEEAVISPSAPGSAQPDPDQQTKNQINRNDPQKSPVFTEHRNDEIRVACRNDIGLAKTWTRAKR